jgi:SAM-dependent methyltransferase
MPHDQDAPSLWITRFASLITANSTLIDVACGHGRHAKYFASHGVNVVAVDRDESALSSLLGVANITVEHRDIENNPWPYAANSFDAVVVCNYLWRPTFDVLLATIKPNGVLIYETFMDGNARFGKPSREDFLLRSNELLERTHGAFRVIAFEEGEEFSDGIPIAMKQKICAIRMG